MVNETGFASDLGFEKYMDLVMPTSGIKPSVAVLVTTVQSLRNQGEGDLGRGFAHLEKHIAIVRGFHLPVVVAINRFPNDTAAELETLHQFCEAHGASFALSEAFAKGGEGVVELANKIVEVIDAHPNVEPITTYAPEDSAVEKITKVARSVYGLTASSSASGRRRILLASSAGASVTCPSASRRRSTRSPTTPSAWGAPTGWTLHVTDVSLSAGAGFLVIVAGSMMLMPGLPKVSRALDIDVDEDGEIIGMS